MGRRSNSTATLRWDPLQPFAGVFVRPVRSLSELHQVYRITHDCYVAKGYVPAQRDGLLKHMPEFDALQETSILVAICRGEIVGSISLTKDGPAGLPFDKDFKAEADLIREEGIWFGAAWRLVVRHDCRGDRRMVTSLIEDALAYFLSQQGDSFLFVVNPSHESVYRRLLNMRRIAVRENTSGLSNAPAVLLRCDARALPRRWYEQLAPRLSHPSYLPARAAA